MTANAAVTVAGRLEAKGEAVIGTTASGKLTVNAAVAVAGRLQARGDAVLGAIASDTLAINAVATFTGGSNLLYNGSVVPSTCAVLSFQRRMSTSAVSTGTVLGKVQFMGWDGVVDGLGAQTRSVFTVSLP